MAGGQAEAWEQVAPAQGLTVCGRACVLLVWPCLLPSIPATSVIADEGLTRAIMAWAFNLQGWPDHLRQNKNAAIT